MRHPRYCLAHHQYFLQYHQRYSPTWYATHANTSTTLPMLTHQPRHPYCHSLTLACQPRNLDKLATHASTPPTRPTLARHPPKHAAHAPPASTYSTPFLKLKKQFFNKNASYRGTYISHWIIRF